jgi:hypothetical protein
LSAHPAPDYLRTVFNRLERFIEDRWQVPVHIQDVPNPFTGDLDGEQILVDYAVDIEDAVFILVHLFGHTVQWNISERAREIAFMRPGQWSEEALAELAAYEREAQELAAIIECTDVEFLPPTKRDKLEKLGGREKLQERLTAIKQILDGQ